MSAGPGRGFVSLVGAGPGDPGLLTIRGRRALERADVVLYDHLASAALLSSVDVPGQERIHVGKRGGAGYASQALPGYTPPKPPAAPAPAKPPAATTAPLVPGEAGASPAAPAP